MDTITKLFPTVTSFAIPSNGKQKGAHKKLGGLAAAMHATQALVELVTQPEIIEAIQLAVRADVSHILTGHVLGEFFYKYEKLDTDAKQALLEALAVAYGVSTVLDAKQFKDRQRMIAIVYAEWPELLETPEGDNDSKAGKRYSYHKAEYAKTVKAVDQLDTLQVKLETDSAIEKAALAAIELLPLTATAEEIAKAKADAINDVKRDLSGGIVLAETTDEPEAEKTVMPKGADGMFIAMYGEATYEERDVLVRLALRSITGPNGGKKVNSMIAKGMKDGKILKADTTPTADTNAK